MFFFFKKGATSLYVPLGSHPFKIPPPTEGRVSSRNIPVATFFFFWNKLLQNVYFCSYYQNIDLLWASEGHYIELADLEIREIISYRLKGTKIKNKIKIATRGSFQGKGRDFPQLGSQGIIVEFFFVCCFFRTNSQWPSRRFFKFVTVDIIL